MTKYYNKEIPTEIHFIYGSRQSGKTYYEFIKLKEENKRLNKIINQFEKILRSTRSNIYIK